MKRTSNLSGRGTQLCQVCGPSINTEDIEFSRKEPNLVYMDKVFSYNQATSCPILQSLNTDNNNFTTKLIIKDTINGCGCDGHRGWDHNHGCGNDGWGCGDSNWDDCDCDCDCDDGCGGSRPNRRNRRSRRNNNFFRLDPDAVFNIDRSYVLVESFQLSRCARLCADDITADGICVDSLDFLNGQFTATTTDLIPQLSKDRCLDLGLPTKAFVLVTAAGPWTYRATFVLEGTVNTDGRTCCFQAKFKSDGAPLSVNSNCTSNFGLPKVSFPCTVSGIAPVINFTFTGKVNMLNPEICINFDNGRLGIELDTMLAIEPKINLEVVRRSLFCIDACEGMLPCDGTEASFETDEEDCTWPPPPACRCGNSPSPEADKDICDVAPICDFEEDDCHCNRSRNRRSNDYDYGNYGGCTSCNGY